MRKVCSTNDCGGVVDATEVYLLLGLMDATCPTCQYKIDVGKAQRSVPLLADAVYAHCEQTARVVYNATKTASHSIVDYPTIWKLTLMNYNVGPNCVFDSVRNALSIPMDLSLGSILSTIQLIRIANGGSITQTRSLRIFTTISHDHIGTNLEYS